jgi:hypothetical protein
VNIILVVGLMVYIASFATSLGICIWLLNSEVYPLEIRGKGSATGSITHWVLDLIIASTVLTLINTITEIGTFWLYAVFGIIGILFFFRVVPETKGRPLEDIEEELESRVFTGQARSGFAYARQHGAWRCLVGTLQSEGCRLSATLWP